MLGTIWGRNRDDMDIESGPGEECAQMHPFKKDDLSG